MLYRIARAIAATLAVVVLVVGLKLFGLAPDDVFGSPQHGGARLDTPFGSFSAHDSIPLGIRPLLIAHILCVPAMWRLCARLGYSSWFGLAMLVPLANILLLYILAYGEWPVGTRVAAGPSVGGNGLPELMAARASQETPAPEAPA